MNHVHHVHLFASDIEKSLAFYRDAFGGKVVLDENMAGARNVFMRVGTGRIHFYDQVPSFSGRGSIHHFGIQTDDINGVLEKLKAMNVPFKRALQISASGNISWFPRRMMCSSSSFRSTRTRFRMTCGTISISGYSKNVYPATHLLYSGCVLRKRYTGYFLAGDIEATGKPAL